LSLQENNEKLSADLRNVEALLRAAEDQVLELKTSKEEAYDDYLRELQLHADSASSLGEMKLELLSERKNKEVMQEELDLLKKSLQDAEKSWNDAKGNLAQQLKDAMESINLLKQQNNVLHKQLSVLLTPGVDDEENRIKQVCKNYLEKGRS
jgi:hypothetical protein